MLCKLWPTCRLFSLIFEKLPNLKELKVVSPKFLLVWLVFLTERTCETRKDVFYFTRKLF